MKKINLLFGTMAIAVFGFTSCSDDDNNSTVTYAGTYNLKQVNTEAPTDFDMDGTAHTDQTQESSCYDGGQIKLNDDGSFTYTITRILVDTATGTSGCATSYTASGTWQPAGAGNSTTISAVYQDQNGNNQVITLTKDGDKLTYVDDNILSQYPDRNSDHGAIYTAGSITYIYQK